MTAPAPAGRPRIGARTSLSDRVVDKIAARAALEVDHVHGTTKGLAASVFAAEPAVGVSSAIDGHLAQLRLQVEVDYPVSLRAVTRQFRDACQRAGASALRHHRHRRRHPGHRAALRHRAGQEGVMTTARTVSPPSSTGRPATPARHRGCARGRRTVAAVIVAVVLLLLAGYAAWQAILVQTGQRPYPLDAAADLRSAEPDPVERRCRARRRVGAGRARAVAAGAWRSIPARRKLVELREDHPDVITGIRAGDLRRALNGAAERVDGISARHRVDRPRRRRGDRHLTAGQPGRPDRRVTAELTEQLDQLDPRRTRSRRGSPSPKEDRR